MASDAPASGIVLCGGRSSRMGRAKAWLPWRGQPVLAHVVARLREVVDDVVVVAAPDQELPDVDARIVRDPEEGLGPLAGLAAGLAQARGELAFVTATDAPYLTADFVRTLLAVGAPVVPEIDGYLQTLSAVYRTDAAVRAGQLLAEGHRRPLDLLEAMRFCKLGALELPDTRAVQGFNTPDAYLAAVREVEPGAEALLELCGAAGEAAGVRACQVPVGTLAEILAGIADAAGLVRDDAVSPDFAVCLDGHTRLRDARAPIGPDERVRVCDATGEA